MKIMEVNEICYFFFRIEDCEESIISLKHIQIYIFMTVSLINFVLHLSQEAISLISFNITFFSALLQVHEQKILKYFERVNFVLLGLPAFFSNSYFSRLGWI